MTLRNLLKMKRVFKSGYWVLFVLTLLFVLPGIAAIWCYIHPQLLASNLINKGTLSNEPIEISRLRHSGSWQLVYVSQGSTPQSDILALEQLARIRLSLGRHLYGLSICLALSPSQIEPMGSVKERLKEMDIRVIKLEALPNQLASNKVLVVNPDGLVVVSYRDDSHPKDIFSDLQQLARLWGK
jgi:hypothetical protein